MKVDVPFYSQNWDIENTRRLGFSDLEEAKYWEDSSCGVLCLKMAIDSFCPTKKDILISDYIKVGLSLKSYTHKDGWSHLGLVELAKYFGFNAKREGKVESENLKDFLNQRGLPIVSIKWAFRQDKKLKERLLFWKKYGGHMALITGYEVEPSGFYVHHTSTIPEYNWQNRFISIEQFNDAFTGRCVVIYPSS